MNNNITRLKIIRLTFTFSLLCILFALILPARTSAAKGGSWTFTDMKVEEGVHFVSYTLNSEQAENLPAPGTISITADKNGNASIQFSSVYDPYYQLTIPGAAVTGRLMVTDSNGYDGGLYSRDADWGYDLNDVSLSAGRVSVDLAAVDSEEESYWTRESRTGEEVCVVFTDATFSTRSSLYEIGKMEVTFYWTGELWVGKTKLEDYKFFYRTTTDFIYGEPETGGYWKLVKTEAYGDYSYTRDNGGWTEEWEKKTNPGICTVSLLENAHIDNAFDDPYIPDIHYSTIFTNNAPKDVYYPGSEQIEIVVTIDTNREGNSCGTDIIMCEIYGVFETNPITDENGPQQSNPREFKPIAESVRYSGPVYEPSTHSNYYELLENDSVGHYTTDIKALFSVPEPNNVLKDKMCIVVTYIDPYFPYVGQFDAYSIYRYEWVPEKAESSEEEKDRTLYVLGTVDDAAGKPMRGISVNVQLCDFSKEDGNGNFSVIMEKEVLTSRNGIIAAAFEDIPDDIAQPGVNFVFTLRGESKTDHAQFVLYDDADPITKETNGFRSEAYIPIPPGIKAELDAGRKAKLYFGIEYAGLLAEDPYLIRYDGDDGTQRGGYRLFLSKTVTALLEKSTKVMTDNERMADASVIYTVVRDAFDFAADTLGEAEAMGKETVKVHLRSTDARKSREDNTKGSYSGASHFDKDEMALEIDDKDSFRDDESLYTVLHEFGHCFDYLTGGKSYHIPQDPDNTPHNGLFNPNMGDSYLEGFATFYAIMVKEYMSYPSPGVFGSRNYGDPKNTFAFSTTRYNCGEEEEAVIAFLCGAKGLFGEVKALWSVLNQHFSSFRDVYEAISSALPAEKAKDLRALCKQIGLFSMPTEGNGVYDVGEPFVDLPEADGKPNGVWDDGERFLDLPYTYNENGEPNRTAVENDEWWALYEDTMIIGVSSDYGRAGFRSSRAKPQTGYLSLGGEAVDYVLVTVRPAGSEAISTLRSAADEEVFLVFPREYEEGTISVQIPGGGMIYESTLRDLAETAEAREYGDPIALAWITEDKLPASDVVAAASFGDPGATGYIVLSPQLNVSMIEERAADIDIDEDESESKTSNGSGMERLGKGLVVLVVFGLIVWIVVLRKKARALKAATVPDYSPAGHWQIPSTPVPTDEASICEYCGTPLAPDTKFCAACGAAIPEKLKPKFCTVCGRKLEEGIKFCPGCGTKINGR